MPRPARGIVLPMPHSPGGTRRSVARVVLIYVVVAAIWILLSDRLVGQVFPDHGAHVLFGTVKGLAFVAATAWLLWAMLQREFARRASTVAALEESELRYRTLFERSQAPMLLVDPVLGHVVDANAAACSFHGYSRERMRGLPLAELSPLGREVLDALIPPGLAAGQSSFQLVHRIADGSLRDVVVHIAPIVVGGRDLHFAILHDVTERVATERALAEATRQLERAQELAQVGSWTLDLRTQHMEWSAEMFRIYGVSAADIDVPLLHLLPRIVHPEDLPALVDMGQRVLAGESVPPSEYRVVRPDGSTRHVSSGRVDIACDEQGRPVLASGVIQDLTDRRQLEQQLFRSQRMEAIGALASGVAHDLNNVLTPVMMIAPMLKDAVHRADEREMLATLEQCAQRGADIIRQLLTFARGEPGARVRLPIRHLFREMDKIIRETFPREIAVTTRIDPDLWHADGDATQIHQVLMNLCINARDAMPAGGRLMLAAGNVVLGAVEAAELATRPGPYVRLAVADTGEGIPAANVDRIFDPFFTTKEVGKGTGLGLSTVLGIVRGHGGTVRLSSQVGHGSTFDVYLPASDVPATTDDVDEPLARPGAGQLILLVDDEDTVRQTVVRTLETGGYRVVAAANGAEALALLDVHAADVRLVLTDMMMPVLNGAALLAALRRRATHVPVVTMTGVFDRDTGTLMADVSATLTKPFTPRELLRTIGRVLRGESDAPVATTPVSPAG